MENKFRYTIHDNFDFTIEEKGNTFIALRKLTWGDKTEPKLDLRKYYNSDSGETVSKGVSFSDEGFDELIRIGLQNNYCPTDDVLESIKDREDFDESYNRVIKAISSDDYYDPREALFKNGD